jgi:hypothetical protein
MKRLLPVAGRLTLAALLLATGACASYKDAPPDQQIPLLPLEASTARLLDNAATAVSRTVSDPRAAEQLTGIIRRIQVDFAAGDIASARRGICTFTGALDDAVAAAAVSRVDANLLLDLSGTILGEIGYPLLCKTVDAQPGPAMLAVAAASACVQLDPNLPIGDEQCNRVATALQTSAMNMGLRMCAAKPYTCAPVDPDACPAPATCLKDVFPFLPKTPGIGEAQPQVQVSGPKFTQNAGTCRTSADGPNECLVRAIWVCTCSCSTEAF